MRNKMAALAYHPVRNGKTADVENQNQHVGMQERPSQPLSWKEIEECLKKDDNEDLEKKLKGKDLNKVWRPAGASAKATLLHLAAQLGSIKCLNLILKAAENADQVEFSIDSPDTEGRTPLFIAVQETQKEVLDLLLRKNGHVNARTELGHTVLQDIARQLSNSTDQKRQELLLDCLNTILSHPGVDLEAKDVWLKTPLVDGAEKFLRKKTEALASFCKKLILKGASLEASNNEGITAAKLLEGKLTLTDLKRDPAQPRPLLSRVLECQMLGEGGEQMAKLLRGRDKEEIYKLSNAYLGKWTLLFSAVKDGDIRTVEVLLEAGANSLKKDLSGEECLHIALSRGIPDILDLILKNMKEKCNLRGNDKIDKWTESFSLLKKILENHGQNNTRKADVDHLMCLRLFLKHVKVDVNACEKGHVSQSLLHLAATYNNQEAAKLFLERGAFLGSRKTVGSEDRGTVLKVLRPETLQRAMDCCIVPEQSQSSSQPTDDSQITEDITSPDYTLNLNYQFLIPALSEKQTSGKINEVKTLMKLSENKTHRKALKHPLIQTFLYAKWRKVLPLYLLNLFFYFIFVVFLTLFMYGVKDLRVKEERVAAHKNDSSSIIDEDLETTRNQVYIFQTFLILFSIYIVVREIFQIVYTFRHYLKDFENYLEWFLIIIVCIFSFAHSSISVDLTRHFAAWGMIIAWYEFVLLLGRAPPLAIYVTMLRHVSWNFLKLIFLYGALILAFSVSFNIILQPTITPEEAGSDFSNFWSTLPKSIVMATGEFEYSELSTTFFSSRAFYATSAVLVFLVFVFLIFLVLMNVMSGLAVTDTQQVVEEATLYSLKSRLELIYLIEEMLLVLRSSKLLSMIHLISEPRNPQLSVRVNQRKNNDRITYGSSKQRSYCKLDDETADTLRSHRLQQLSQEAEKAKLDPAKQCLEILKELKDLAIQNPQILRQMNQSSP